MSKPRDKSGARRPLLETRKTQWSLTFAVSPIPRCRQDHSAESGDVLVLQAAWTNERTLGLIFKHAERTVSEWAYSVSADGHSMVVSTTEQVVVFERIE